MIIRYFAWVRERTGVEQEEITLPDSVTTVGGLINWLQTIDDAHGHAFAEPELIRAAIDQTHAEHDASILGAREIAFFPPMTGG